MVAWGDDPKTMPTTPRPKRKKTKSHLRDLAADLHRIAAQTKKGA